MIKHNKQETTAKTIGSIEGTSAIVLCEIKKTASKPEACYDSRPTEIRSRNRKL